MILFQIHKPQTSPVSYTKKVKKFYNSMGITQLTSEVNQKKK